MPSSATATKWILCIEQLAYIVAERACLVGGRVGRSVGRSNAVKFDKSRFENSEDTTASSSLD